MTCRNWCCIALINVITSMRHQPIRTYHGTIQLTLSLLLSFLTFICPLSLVVNRISLKN
jgi:hypothetical protein